MGKVMSFMRYKVSRFNVENRAHRFLDQEKLTPAPKFESSYEDIKRALEVDPDLVDKLNRKDSNLDNRLKKVFVTSEDSYIDYASQCKENPNRPLPSNRHTPEYFEYGYQEPRHISHGRCTLRQALQFITDHQGDSEMWTAKKISDDYKLKKNQVGNILLFFKTFNIRLPNIKAKDGLLSGNNSTLPSQNDDSKFT